MKSITENKMGIYAIVFPTDHGEKFYIGSTCKSFKERFKQHCRSLNRKTHHNPLLQNYWNKYKSIVEFRILEVRDSTENILTREQFYIDSVDKKNILNCGPAIPNPMYGRHHTEESKKKLSLLFTGRKHTEEAINKIRISKIGKPGTPHTEFSKEKMRRNHKHKKHTPEEIEKIRIGNTGKIISEETREKLRQIFLGRKHTYESLLKMSLSQTGRKHTAETKKKMSETNSLIWNTEEGRKKRSESVKKGWGNRRLHKKQKEQNE